MTRASALLPLVAGLLALGLYLGLPVERFFSDSPYLLHRVEVGAPPYYNVAYLPLGRLADLLLGSWLGAERALLVLDAAAVALAVVVTGCLARRAGAGAAGTLAAAGLLALAPGALFFAGVIEVHAVQLAGASLAVGLALAAGDRPPGRAWTLVALAGLVALVTHLSHVLLLPGLLVLARGRPAAEGERAVGGMLAPDTAGGERRGLTLGPAGVPWILGAVLALGGLVAALVLVGPDGWRDRPALQWLHTLVVFGDAFLGSLAERGPFPPSEALAYLGAELVAPLAFLAAGLVVGPVLALAPAERADEGAPAGSRIDGAARRRVVRRALVACVPALLVLPQGGVLERGGYFLTLAPLLALVLGLGVDRLARLAARRPGASRAWVLRVLVLLALLGQLQLALAARAAFREAGPDARDWAAAAAARTTAGDSALVSTLARTFTLAGAAPGVHVRDLARDLDLEPARGREQVLRRVLGERLGDARYPGDLWLDGALLPTWPAAPGVDEPAWRGVLFELLAGSPVPVEVVGEGPLRLLRVVRR